MAVTFTNGRVALRDDLIFGTVVLTERGWLPVNELDSNDAQMVLDLLMHNPTCPQRFYDTLRAQIEDAKETCPFCGLRTPTPCDTPPPDTCEHALNNS